MLVMLCVTERAEMSVRVSRIAHVHDVTIPLMYCVDVQLRHQLSLHICM